MEYSFDYELSEDLIRQCNREFLRTHLHWRAKLAAVAYVVLALMMVIYDPGVKSGIVAGAGVLLFLLVGIAYSTLLRRSRALLRKLPHRHASCVLDDDGVHIENALGKTNLEWRMLEKVVRGPEVWLMIVSRYHNFPLPAAALTDGARQFITAKVTSAGGRTLPKAKSDI